MSLQLEFEPHSWYKHFAIRHYIAGDDSAEPYDESVNATWTAYTDNGNTGYIDSLRAGTLADLKQQITQYHKRNTERDAYNRRMIGEK